MPLTPGFNYEWVMSADGGQNDVAKSIGAGGNLRGTVLVVLLVAAIILVAH